jgi:hypothetical protein
MTPLPIEDTNAIVDKAIERFRGTLPELENAIGALYAGRRMGWKVLVLIHEKRTLRKYEQILGIEFREVLPDVGELAHKSVAWKAVQKLGNFWKAVKGEIKGVRTPDIEPSP